MGNRRRVRNRKKMGRPTLLTESMIKQSSDLILMGFTHEKVAEFYGVSITSIYHWKTINPDFSEAMNISREENDSKVVRSLFEIATGYNYTERKTEIEKDPITGKEKVKKTRTKKHIAPNVGAIKVWLYNRRSTEFKPETALSTQVEGEQLPPPPLTIYYSVKPPVRPASITVGKGE